MAVKKFYSNKHKSGWKENPSHVSPGNLPTGEKQKDEQKKYYSWGYDIDLDPIEYDDEGNAKRNRRREAGFAARKDADTAGARLKYSEKGEYSFKKIIFPTISEAFQGYLNRLISKKERNRATTIFNRFLTLLETNVRLDEIRTWHLNLYLEEKRGKVKDGSINREMTNIASAHS